MTAVEEARARVETLLAALDAELAARYPGPDVGRQPVHSVYVPADRFDAGTVTAWGSAALDALERAGGPQHLLEVHGLLPPGDERDRVAELVVAKLRGKRLVSDDRFAASFVHHHAQRGQGPVRIRTELRQQGVSDELIEAQLQEAEFDWVALAAAVRQRKFGATAPRNMAERAKQARFLQYRGFDSDQIRAALKSGMESCDSVTDGDAGLDLD